MREAGCRPFPKRNQASTAVGCRILAAHYGFLISACPPFSLELKGGVENDVNFVKRNFLPLFMEGQKPLGHAPGLVEELILELDQASMGADWRVQFQKAFYSVPYRLIGQRVLVMGNFRGSRSLIARTWWEPATVRAFPELGVGKVRLPIIGVSADGGIHLSGLIGGSPDAGAPLLLVALPRKRARACGDFAAGESPTGS